VFTSCAILYYCFYFNFFFRAVHKVHYARFWPLTPGDTHTTPCVRMFWRTPLRNACDTMIYSHPVWYLHWRTCSDLNTKFTALCMQHNTTECTPKLHIRMYFLADPKPQMYVLYEWPRYCMILVVLNLCCHNVFVVQHDVATSFITAWHRTFSSSS